VRLHLREAVYEDDEIIVEDIFEEVEGQDPNVLRTLYIKENPRVIQGQIPLVYRNSKSSELKQNQITLSVLKEKKKQKVISFDR